MFITGQQARKGESKSVNIEIEIYKEGNMLGYLIKTDKNNERLNLSGFVSYYSLAATVAGRVRELIEKGEN